MICNYKVQFKKDFNNLIYEANKNNATVEQKRSTAVEFLKNTLNNAQNAGISNVEEYLDDWSQYVDKTLQKYGVNALGPEQIQGFILGNYKNIEQDQPATTTSLDIEIKQRNQYRKDFIDRIYQGADEVKRFALKQADVVLNEALLFSRDNKTITKNDVDLNHNIRQVQQSLFDTVQDFLRTYYSRSENQLENQDYSQLNSDLQLYLDGKYTGAFESIFNIASQVFNTFNKDRLLREFNYRTPALKAFNAFQTLLHFDEFLINSLGDNIKVYDMDTRFSDEFKYSLAAKASNMFWTNGDNDDIDVTKSVNNLSKMIVQTSRLYDFNTGNPIQDEYLTFGQYVTAITKLKDLSWNQLLTRGILLNDTFRGKRTLDISNLSLESQNYIKSLGKEATLATLINYTRKNPRQAFSTLFELLYELRNDKQISPIWRKFNNEEKNVLTSLYKEIFGVNQSRSLRSIQDFNGYTEKNIFDIIL